MEVGRILRHRYRLENRLASGGMGEIYVASDLQCSERKVAVKSLHAEIGDKTHQLFQRRFREEVGILQRLRVAGVPAFVDAFDEGERSFLIMEYIEGHSLDVLLEQAREQGQKGLPPRFVASAALQVCHILETLHNQVPPLIHRDIKPSNIIVRSEDKQVFLVDFGLAREFSGESGAKTLVGTVGYCPLEQFQGHPEPRSDLYALGATMFELTTGTPPSPLNIPPLQSVLPQIAEEFCGLVDHCVKNGLEERPATATEVAERLEAALPLLHDSGTDPEDRIHDLVRLWGAGKRHGNSLALEEEPPPLLTLPPPSFGPVVLPLPPVGPKQNARRRRLALALGVLLVLLLGAYVNTAWSERHYQAAQRALVLDTYPEGGPGSGWILQDAAGLFPAEDLGLGDPANSWGRSGLFFQQETPVEVRFLHAQLRRLKGNPRLLVFSAPWGVLVEPGADQDHYRLCLAQVRNAENLFHFQLISPFQDLSLEIGEFRRLDVGLQVQDGQLTVSLDRQPVLQTQTALGWRSQSCGVVLLNSVRNHRCVVSNWQIL